MRKQVGRMAASYDWPRSWRGAWLTAERIDAAGPEPAFSSLAAAPFTRHLYRGAVDLDAVPATAPLRVTADSRYVLLVNGVEVGRGPVRSQPRRLRYDAYDIAPHLVVGTNRVVVLVTYYGVPNSFWQPAPSNGALGGRGAMVLEADLGDRRLVTDETWEVRRIDAWTQATAHGIDGVPVERFDARRLEADWGAGGGEGWVPASVTPATHVGSLARTRPPTDPYGALLPRPIGALGAEEVRPVAATTAPAPAPQQGADEDSPADHVLSVWPHVPEGSAADPRDVVLAAAGPARFAVAFDFGRVVAGATAFELDAPEGTVLDALYRETPTTPADAFVMAIPRAGLRYVARGHDDRFVAQEVNGFRYAHLVVTVPEAGEVRLRGLRVVERLGRWSDAGSFASSDPELDALYAAGIRTVALNTQDAFLDCPTREQRAWVGDGVVHQLVHLTTNDDRRPAAWYVALGTSPRPDGILPMSVVGEIESGQGTTIPDWSLYWIHGVHNLLMHCGVTDEVRAAAPVARRVLEWFLPYRTVDGVLADVPEWRLVDWSSILLSGESAILTALWARALLDYADVADALGNGGDVRWARELHEGARAGFGRFWDEGRGTVVDHLDGDGPAAASQLAGATAVVGGLLDEQQVSRTIAWIGDPARQVVRSWIGGDGGFDEAKIVEQMQGVQRIDWDADRETVVAQPFAAFVVHDAYAAAGRPDLVVASCRRWSAFLRDGFDSFGECWGWGTPAHGWSSTPTRDLIQHVLGVLPAKPGFAGARIAPAFGVAEHLSGSHPTVHGPIRVTVSGRHASVSSPVPFVLVDADGHERRFEAGEGAVD